MGLNEEQNAAVLHTTGPLLIIAGAGTGKTTVIVEKIKKLISDKLAKPEEILALTFTEKAALEMEERVDKSMPYGYFQMWINTFHSFADQILRDEISHIGLNPTYKLLTQAETVYFLRKNLFRMELQYFRPLGNPNKFIEAMLQHFSRLRDEDISPEEYTSWAVKQKENTELTAEEIEKNIELARAYSTFQEMKIRESYFDFSDLIFYLLKLFRERPSILKKYQSLFKYILIDEFQDTNVAQYLLMKLLCPPGTDCNLTVVGDDSQAIYKFRGASISNILTFMKDYPNAEQITLSTNYRSYQEVLDTSHKLVQFNNPDTLESQLGISKKLKAQRGAKKDIVSLSITERSDGEAEFVARQILTEKQKNNYKYSDFALLVRANSHADAFVSTFIRQGIPFRFLGPGMLFKQPEVKDLIAYLKVLYNIEDSVSLYRVLCMEIFQIDARDIAHILAFSKKTNLTLFNAIEAWITNLHPFGNYMPLMREETKQKLVTIYEMIKRHLARSAKDSAGQILYYFLEDTGYIKLFTSYKTEKEERTVLNITKFFNKLKTFENEHEDASVTAVVDYIELSMEMGESPIVADTDAVLYDAVNIMTIHGAKGLEFPVVFLTNLSKGRFPTYEKKETFPIPLELVKEILPQGDYHLQEERRLCYVGMTRAKDRLFLTASKTYGDGKRIRKLSPFVAEALGEEYVANFESIKTEEKEQLSIFDFKKPEEPISREKLPLTNFSYSQMESFNTCALQYKYQYILKVPTSPSGALSFGDTVHKTLQRFYQEYMQNSSVDLTRMLEIYEHLWIPLGYASPVHQEKMKAQGREMLEKFYKTYHSKDTKILGLEKLFKIKIHDNVFVTGKIDRIDTHGDGIEIIDYKTGKKPDDKELKKSLQLSIYAIAATDKSLYNKPLKDITLTFYYMQDMQKVSMTRDALEVEEVKAQIVEVADKIRSDLFTPKVGLHCNFCSFKMICEAWQ